MPGPTGADVELHAVSSIHLRPVLALARGSTGRRCIGQALRIASATSRPEAIAALREG
ncbi:DUF4072 domain-containing protein [Hymenobacter sediminis]|nr:DUF4072 domain-containing protein [Hymenobacter sediminis]